MGFFFEYVNRARGSQQRIVPCIPDDSAAVAISFAIQSNVRIASIRETFAKLNGREGALRGFRSGRILGNGDAHNVKRRAMTAVETCPAEFHKFCMPLPAATELTFEQGLVCHGRKGPGVDSASGRRGSLRREDRPAIQSLTS